MPQSGLYLQGRVGQVAGQPELSVVTSRLPSEEGCRAGGCRLVRRSTVAQAAPLSAERVTAVPLA